MQIPYVSFLEFLRYFIPRRAAHYFPVSWDIRATLETISIAFFCKQKSRPAKMVSLLKCLQIVNCTATNVAEWIISIMQLLFYAVRTF
jgi:hypothetical protein